MIKQWLLNISWWLRGLKNRFRKNKLLPTIRVGKIKSIKMDEIELFFDDDNFYKKIAKIAKKEIPDSELVSWWVRQALTETCERMKAEKKIVKKSKKRNVDLSKKDDLDLL